MLKRLFKAFKGHRPAHNLSGWPKDRGYDLHLPTQQNGKKERPLILAIHGYTHDGVQMAGLTAPDGDPSHPLSLNSLATEEGFAVAYPYGTRIGFLPGRCWNAGGGINGYAPVGDPARRKSINDVQFFQDLIQNLSSKFQVDKQRIYLLGISNGGAMAQRLAMEVPHLWAAVATVAGCNQHAAASQVTPKNPVPLLHIHGTEDKIWPYEGGPMQSFGLMESVDASIKGWAEANSAEVANEVECEPKNPSDPTRVRYRRYQGTTDLELYTVLGGGHAWPSGYQYLPEKVMGSVSSQLDTNRLIWNFFERHART